MINTRIHFTDGSSVLKTLGRGLFLFLFLFFLEREAGSRGSDNYQIKILTPVLVRGPGGTSSLCPELRWFVQ